VSDDNDIVGDENSRRIGRRRVLQLFGSGAVGVPAVASLTGDAAAAPKRGFRGSVTIPTQETAGGTVTISQVYMETGGYVSIHDLSRFAGIVCQSIVGITELLEPGRHTDVEVPMYNTAAPAGDRESAVPQSQPYVAIPHESEDGQGAFDCSEDGAYRDGRRSVDSIPVVNDLGLVYLEGDTKANRKEARRLHRDIRRGALVVDDSQDPAELLPGNF
jgi:hypothetical protein